VTVTRGGKKADANSRERGVGTPRRKIGFAQESEESMKGALRSN